jgi:hypothetical protein
MQWTAGLLDCTENAALPRILFHDASDSLAQITARYYAEDLNRGFDSEVLLGVKYRGVMKICKIARDLKLTTDGTRTAESKSEFIVFEDRPSDAPFASDPVLGRTSSSTKVSFIANFDKLHRGVWSRVKRHARPR